MNRLILPAPLATALVTQQPHDFERCRCNQWGRCLVDCPTSNMPMVAQWVTQPDDCPYVGERVEFVVTCQACGGTRGWVGAFGSVRGSWVRCPDCTDGQRVVGSGVVAESLPILAEGQDPYTAGVPIPPSGYVPHIAMSRDRLLWWKGRSETENLSTGRPTWVTADITDQLHGQDWSPGRWAWRVTEAVAS